MKRRCSSIALLSLLVIALAIVPVLALTVSAAESTTVSKTNSDLATIAGVQIGDKVGVIDGIVIALDDNINIVFDKNSSTSAPCIFSDGVRLYQGGGTLTVKASSAGVVIKSVEIVAGSTSYKGTGGSVSIGTFAISGTNVSISNVNSDEVVFTTQSAKSGRLYVKSISVTYELQSNVCAHDNTYTEVTTKPTCTEEGTETTICNDCEAVIKTEVIAALGHDYVGGECFICGEAELVESGPKWQLTDIANIKATDVVVITMTTSDGTTYAMSNDKGTGSAPTAVKVTVEGDTLNGDIDDNIKWNISKNGNNLTIYPNGTTAKWLYCTNDNNGVRVGTNANKVFTIDSASGDLKHTGTSRYLGVYNSADWRCYSPIHNNIANQTLGFYVLTGATAEPKISGAQLQIDDTLAIKYLATLGDNGYDTSKLAMRFTYGLEGDKVSVVTESQKQTDGRYAFLFTGIAPQSMSDNIKAELIYDGVVIDTIEEYSVKDYAANIINKYASSDVEKHQKVVRLLSDMLHYGAEAQKYLGYNTENLANDGVNGILEVKTNAVPENSDKGDDIAEGYTNVVLAAAGVRFDYNNKVYIKFDIDGIDINTVTVLVNGNEAEIVLVDGKYTVYTKGIKANEFDNVQTFEIFVGGHLVVTATYSVNSYAYSKGNGETKIAPLAKAMYYYGLAAESYSANN